MTAAGSPAGAGSPPGAGTPPGAGSPSGAGQPPVPGLQPERTELAWRRTALSVAAVSLVGARLLPALFGSAVWLLPGLVGLMLAGYLLIASRRRHGRRVPVPPRGPGHDSPGAGLLAVAGAIVVTIGLGGLVVVLATHLWA
ncbi:DUF202 domain-containing protein [Promicromonospora sp. NPDC060204]|uniref:DUF202 domain-containing protein n=1 Tax=Promicromonospora sp. NPDC060204 TaxID=3347071 RepID=UPI003669FF20